MAAYAALVSLMHMIEQIKHHPRPPFYLDNKHAQSLIEKVTFLQKFLEDYSHVRNEQIDRLESLIAKAAYAAEDLIENHVVDQILSQSARHGKRVCSVAFYQDLRRVIQDMDFIKKEVMEIKDEIKERGLMPAAGFLSSSPPVQNTMVGCDDVLKHIMDKLTRPQCSKRQVIPIVGMGGLGKTTLAKNVYENAFIVQHFYIRAWATVSQEYSIQKILLKLLLCLNSQDKGECLSGKSEMELRDSLYKSLCGRRYLIILDDMWSIDAWDKVKSLFPSDNNGSSVIITTRLSKVALDLTGGDKGLEMNFLDDDISWNLLCKTVFGKDSCPLELEESGKKIAKSCNGLPLSIVVIGGLLAKSEKTQEYWEYIAKNLNSSEEKEYCLNLLYTSYNHLPIYLKPCFLYMGMFVEEHDDIDVQLLISLWVVEGFLKPANGKSLEEVGAEYLKDLIDRNLILIEKRNHYGEVKSCKIHDLLLDLCLREIEKDKFLVVRRQYNVNNSLRINTQRRVAIYGSTSEEENQSYFPQIRDALHSALLARTLVCDAAKVLPSPNFRLLRVLACLGSSQGEEFSFSDYIFQLVNLRFILVVESHVKASFPSSINLFWNLQTIIIPEDSTTIQSFDIWKMPLLRFVVIAPLHLRNPGQIDFVLENLRLLAAVKNFRCSEKVVKRIPNIKVLTIYYNKRYIESRYCLNNLVRLRKLEYLCCAFNEETPSRSEFVQNLTFPHSLKQLILKGCCFYWEDISIKIGSLPHLQVLELADESFIGPEWETIDGQFCSLKILKIKYCSGLKCWKTDSSHFPRLERLVLAGLGELEEIPSAIGEIPTLQSIKLIDCSYSAVISAKEIATEQEELENLDLRVLVRSGDLYDKIKTLASPNFEVVRD